MKLYLKLSASILLALIGYMSFSQDSPQVLPPAPDVAALEKYGSIPTTYYTGLPNVSIPLYTITSRSISVPISLSYHALGVKVNDINGPVGIGWSLSAGGYLTRTIKGHEDGTTSGFDSESAIQTYIEAYRNADETISEEIYCGNYQDNDIDIYSYSTPSGGGKFFYDHDDSIRFMPVARMKVDASNVVGNTLEGYIMTDLNGTEYLFDAIEKQQPAVGSGSFDCMYSSGVSETSKLSRITSLDGGEVTFTYDTISYEYLTDYSQFRVKQTGTEGYGTTDWDNWSGVDVFQGRRLKEIETSEGFKVTFEYSGYNGMLITGINILHNEEEVKSFDLSYSSYQSSNAKTPFIPAGYYNDRHKLTSITESGKGKYTLTYNTTKLSPRFSFAQDFWGYSNGAIHNTSGVPDKSVEGEVFNVAFATGDRFPNETYAKAGVLEKITYPTGGTTEFEFESNSFYDTTADTAGCVAGYKTISSVFDVQAISGLCAQQVEDSVHIIIPSGSKQVKIYFESNGDFMDTPPLSCSNGDTVNYSLVSYGSTSFANTSPMVDIGDFVGTIVIESKANGYGDDSNLVWISATVTWQEPYETCPDLAGAPIQKLWGGLRLKSKESKASATSEPIKQSYSYDSAVYQTPKFTSKIKTYTTEGTAGCTEPATVDPTTFRSYPIVASSTLFGGAVIYNQVIEYLGEDPTYCYEQGGTVICPNQNDNIGKTEYRYDHQQDIIVIHPTFGFGYIIDFSYRRGHLLESKVFGYDQGQQSFHIVSKTSNTYSNQLEYTHYGIDVRKLRDEILGDSSCLNYPAHYEYVDYPYYSEWVRLDESITTEYFYHTDNTLAGTHEVTTNYTYSSTNLLPTTVETVFPRGAQKTNNVYENSHAIGKLTKATNYKRLAKQGPYTQIGETYYTYTEIDSMVLITGILAVNGQDTLSNSAFSYDNEYRITTVIDSISDLVTTYKYANAQDTYPSIECINCTDAAYEGFEKHTDSLRDDQAKSGTYIYDLSDGSVSITAPSTYNIDYWKKDTLLGEWYKSSSATYSGGAFIISGTGYIDNIIVYPDNGQVRTYAFDPGLKIRTVTDHNGVSTHYRYDDAGRLERQLDDNFNIISKYMYHLKTQE